MKRFNLPILAILFIFTSYLIFCAPKVQAAAVNTATFTNVNPSTYHYTTFKGVPVYRLHITNSGDAPDTLLSLTPTPYTGDNVDDTLITLHFYKDTNDNGTVDNGDTDLGASTHFASDNTKQVFTFPTPLAIPVGVTSILITADGGPAVGNAQIFHLSIALGTDILMGTVAINNTTDFPLVNAGPLTISDTAPSLSITNGANDPIAKTATASATGVIVKQLSITAAATSDSIMSLAITPSGTENDATQISSVKFYIDSGTTPGVIDGSDILLSTTPTTYAGDNTKTVFTFLSPLLIPGNTTVNILLTYDLGSGVAGGNTLMTQLISTTDAIAGSGIISSSNSSSISSTITIANLQNISIASTKIISPNTLLVTFNNPNHNLVSVDFTKWHIDVNNTGIGSLTPVSAAITSAGSPWTVTLTFAGTPFSNTASSNDAAHGLYVDALGVTDTNGDTNVIVGNAASILISDGQAPTLSLVHIVSNNATTSLAKTGDIVTLTFTSSESVSTPIVTIRGASAVVTGGPTAWSATYTMLITDTEGVIPFTINFTDLSSNTGTQVSTVTDASSVAFDRTAPTTQNTVFASSTTKVGGVSVTVVSSGDATNTIWFAPSGTLTFVAGATMTTASGTATSILAPATAGSYRMFVIDAAGNISTQSTEILTVDNTAPTAAITYGINHAVKAGDSQVITATFGEPIADAPVMKIAISGANVVAATVMTKTDTTHYTYTHTVTSGDGTATVALSIGTDLAGNAITSAPTSGATFIVNNTAPNVPTASPMAGAYSNSQNITLSSISSTSIRFTTNGSIPDACSSGTAYNGPIQISSSQTINAIGCDDIGNISTVGEFIYTIEKNHTSGSFMPTKTKTSIVPIFPSTGTPNITQITNYNLGPTNLKNGSAGEPVKELQRFLNKVLNLGLVVDGKLGPKTVAIIKQWQKANGLVADGIVGPKTKTMMNSIK